MFCNRCGTQLQPTFKLCPKCGNPVTAGAASAIPERSRLDRHLRTVGVLWIIFGALWLIPSAVTMLLSHGARLTMGDEIFGHAFMRPLFFSFGAISLLVAAGGVLGGLGLMRYERWARTVTIIFAVLALFHPPFFTALGIYTLWVLLPADSASEYEQLSRS